MQQAEFFESAPGIVLIKRKLGNIQYLIFEHMFILVSLYRMDENQERKYAECGQNYVIFEKALIRKSENKLQVHIT